jgi:hypothetical protein
MKQKNRINYLGLSIVLLLSAGSCVTPFTPKLNLEDSKPLLVVEGQITDQEGPFSVKLTTTAPVNDLATPEPVLNADVWIIDNQGHSYTFYGGSNGIYTTRESNLKGIPGNKYTLIINMLDDSLQYTSPPVLMQQVPDIDSVYFQQVQHSRITEGKAYTENWVNVLVDVHDTSGITNCWRWDYVETYGVRKIIEKEPILKTITCWVTAPNASILVASTAGKPVNELKGFIIKSIGPWRCELSVGYSILIKQYSVDADLYNYWKQLRDVNETPGGIYSKMPAQVFGNITCSDNTRKALGYFTASSVKERRFNIKRSDNYQMDWSYFEGECGSIVAPPFWW